MMSEDLLQDINVALLIVLPALGFLQDLRYRFEYVREAENGKDTLRRFLRSALLLLLHLGVLCLFYLLIWWMFSHLPNGTG